MQSIIILILLFFAKIAYTGPLDINDIQSYCLDKHVSVASVQYIDCVNEKVNNKMLIKSNDQNKKEENES